MVAIFPESVARRLGALHRVKERPGPRGTGCVVLPTVADGRLEGSVRRSLVAVRVTPPSGKRTAHHRRTPSSCGPRESPVSISESLRHGGCASTHASDMSIERLEEVLVEAVERDHLVSLHPDLVAHQELGQAGTVDQLDPRVDPLRLRACAGREPGRGDEDPAVTLLA